MNRLRIAEVFESVQGEGILTGVPSVFVRVSGCNLRCIWCDTPYASWNPIGEVFAVESVVDLVAEYGSRHVVLTGGEPMLFPGVVDLCRSLKARGHHITIETAGTVAQDVECDLMSISPKLSSSTPFGTRWEDVHEMRRTNLDVLRQLSDRYDCQWKFVVGDQFEDDFAEIETLLTQVPVKRNDRVILMPEGTDPAALARHRTEILGECLARGYRFGVRLHIDLFGNTMGT